MLITKITSYQYLELRKLWCCSKDIFRYDILFWKRCYL